jgi:biopolymer transport protein ExbB/TolQ
MSVEEEFEQWWEINGSDSSLADYIKPHAKAAYLAAAREIHSKALAEWDRIATRLVDEKDRLEEQLAQSGRNYIIDMERATKRQEALQEQLKKYEGASEHQCIVSESNTGNATREWIYLDACALIGQPVTVWVKRRTE